MLFEPSVVRGFDPHPDPTDLGIIVPFSGTIEVRRHNKSSGNEWDENGGRHGIRTHDPGVANAVLSQLS